MSGIGPVVTFRTKNAMTRVTNTTLVDIFSTMTDDSIATLRDAFDPPLPRAFRDQLPEYAGATQPALEPGPVTADVPIDDIAAALDPIEAAYRDAKQALAAACIGWQLRRRCTGPNGERVEHPHPGCLQAQYQHDVILIEHGLAR